MTNKPTITQADRDAAAALIIAKPVVDNPDIIIHKGADDSGFVQALANHREAAVTELQVEVEWMREALRMAANQFRYYEQNHRLKGTTDGIAKAVANRRCAEQCEAALAQKKHAT